MDIDTRNMGLLGLLGNLNLSPPTPIPEKNSAHFESLGRFIVAYANAEGAVHMLARRLSNLDDEKARAIFSGMRLSDLTDRIRHMMRLDKVDQETSAEVDTCLVQLDLIAQRRHKIVHRSVSIGDDGAVQVSNWSTSKSLSTQERDVFKLTDIENMRMDCLTIFVRLGATKSAPSLVDALMSKGILTELRGPWHYKPAQPAPQKKQPRKTRKVRQRQPASSRGLSR